MTPDEIRAQRTETEARWRKKIHELAEAGEFYTGDLYEALLHAGEVIERKQYMYQEANYLLRRMEAEGELTSELRLRQPSPCRRYYRKVIWVLKCAGRSSGGAG